MSITQILFWLLSVVAIFSALMVITSKNPVYSVLWLIVTFFTISGHYILLNAQFLAIVNVIVYAGAIMVLFLFVIMFLNPAALEQQRGLWWGFGTLLAMILAGVLVPLVATNDLPADPVAATELFGSPEMLAKSLFSDYVLPFEIASVLLLVAIIGAVVLAKREH